MNKENMDTQIQKKFETSRKMGAMKTGINRQKVVFRDAVGYARHLKIYGFPGIHGTHATSRLNFT